MSQLIWDVPKVRVGLLIWDRVSTSVESFETGECYATRDNSHPYLFEFAVTFRSYFFKNDNDKESGKYEKRIEDLFLEIIQKKEEEMGGKVERSDTYFLGLLVSASQDIDRTIGFQ